MRREAKVCLVSVLVLIMYFTAEFRGTIRVISRGNKLHVLNTPLMVKSFGL